LQDLAELLTTKVDAVCETSERIWSGEGGVRVGKWNEKGKAREMQMESGATGRGFKLSTSTSGVEQEIMNEESSHRIGKGKNSIGLGHPSRSSNHHQPPLPPKRNPHPSISVSEENGIKNQIEEISNLYSNGVESFEKGWRNRGGSRDGDGDQDQMRKERDRDPITSSSRNSFLLESILKSLISKPEEVPAVLKETLGQGLLEHLLKPISSLNESQSHLSASASSKPAGLNHNTSSSSLGRESKTTNLLELILYSLTCCERSKDSSRRVLTFCENLVVLLFKEERESEVSEEDIEDSEAKKPRPKFTTTELDKFLLALMDCLEWLDLRVEIEDENQNPDRSEDSEVDGILSQSKDENRDPDPTAPSKDLELELFSYLKEIRRYPISENQVLSNPNLTKNSGNGSGETRIGPKRAISLSQHGNHPSTGGGGLTKRFFSSSTSETTSTQSSSSGLSNLTLKDLGQNAADFWNYGMSGSVATLNGFGLGLGSWRNVSNGSDGEELKISSPKSTNSQEITLDGNGNEDGTIVEDISDTSSSSIFIPSTQPKKQKEKERERATSLLKGMGIGGSKGTTVKKASATSSVTSVPASLSLSRFASPSGTKISKDASTPIASNNPNVNSVAFPSSPTSSLARANEPSLSFSNLQDVQEDSVLDQISSDSNLETSILIPTSTSSSSSISLKDPSDVSMNPSSSSSPPSSQIDSKAQLSLKEFNDQSSPSTSTTNSSQVQSDPSSSTFKARIRSISDVGGNLSDVAGIVNLNPFTTKKRNRVMSSNLGSKDEIRVLRNGNGMKQEVTEKESLEKANTANRNATEGWRSEESPTQKAAARILKTLLGEKRSHPSEQQDKERDGSLNSVPLTIALCRRLLLVRFPASNDLSNPSSTLNATVHRKLILLLVIRWYAFTHLGHNLLMRPNRSGNFFNYFTTNSIHLGISNRDSSYSNPENSRWNIRMLNDSWIHDPLVGRELGELHKKIYETLLRVTGFSQMGSKSGESRQGDGELERSARKLVGLFGVGKSEDLQKAKEGYKKESKIPAASKGEISILRFEPQELLSLVNSLGPILLRKKPSDSIKDSSSKERTASTQAQHRPVSQSDLDQLSSELRKEVRSVQKLLLSSSSTSSIRSRKFKLFHITRKFSDGKFMVGCELSGIQRELFKDKAASTRATCPVAGNAPQFRDRVSSKPQARPSARSDSLQKSILSSHSPTSSSSSPMGFMTQALPTSVSNSSSAYGSSVTSSSGFSISTVGNHSRRHGNGIGSGSGSGMMSSSFHSNGSNAGWGSPPGSPFDEGGGGGFFDLQGESNGSRARRRKDSSSNGTMQRSDSLNESLRSNSVVFPCSNGHQKEATVNANQNSFNSNSNSSRPSKAHVFSSLTPVTKIIESSQIPPGELRRGIFTLLRRYPISNETSTSLRDLLAKASVSSKLSHDYESSLLFDNTLSWLNYIVSSHPSLAFGVIQDEGSRNSHRTSSPSSEEPAFHPILSYLSVPLLSSEQSTNAFTLELQSGLSDLEVLRRGMIDSARSIFARMFELRAKAWYASEVRINRSVIQSRVNALNSLETTLSQANREAIIDDEDEDGQTDENPKQWMQRLGVYDFEVGKALEKYFMELDGAFAVITGDANLFFSSPLRVCPV